VSRPGSLLGPKMQRTWKGKGNISSRGKRIRQSRNLTLLCHQNHEPSTRHEKTIHTQHAKPQPDRKKEKSHVASPYHHSSKINNVRNKYQMYLAAHITHNQDSRKGGNKSQKQPTKCSKSSSARPTKSQCNESSQKASLPCRRPRGFVPACQRPSTPSIHTPTPPRSPMETKKREGKKG